MSKHYIFFTRDELPQPGAHIVQIVHLANAAANLGYSTILAHSQTGIKALNPIDWVFSFRPKKPDKALINYYSLQDKLKIVPLSMPFPSAVKSKWTDFSTVTCKYYAPLHLFPQAQIVHSRDWNFVKTAVKYGIPAIYERDHYEKKRYEPEIVNDPRFLLAVTVADTVKDNLIKNGIPAEKTIKLHNGFNHTFFQRHPEDAKEWREKLLNDTNRLVVYSGELHRFKGIDLLIEIAKDFLKVQFALAGGTESQIQHYQQIIRDRQIKNVTLVGYLPHHRLVSLLQAADVLVYPHLSGEAANFTSPMKLFDYIAAGNPIITTKIPPLKEFESSSLISAWCDPDSPAEFASCLQQVLIKYPNWSPDHLHDYQLVRQFSWEARIEQTLDRIDPAFRPRLA
jgi:glycosyltransferase involved in cell wall biosynthesis